MDICPSEQELLNSNPSQPLQPAPKASTVLSSTFNKSNIRLKQINLKKLYPKDEADDYPEKVAFLLKNVFTKQECQDLIALSEKNGYSPALLNVGAGREILAAHVRSSYRTIIDDEEFAKILWARISSYIPDPFKEHAAVGVNERLRFLRYDPGDKFKMHQDGTYVRPDRKERSMITLQIYLNEGFKGGETTFIGTEEKRNIPVVPKEGMILVFQQNITHEGSELKVGRKYTIRTEVMYKT